VHSSDLHQFHLFLALSESPENGRLTTGEMCRSRKFGDFSNANGDLFSSLNLLFILSKAIRTNFSHREIPKL
jgi:hypothetical protein